MNKGFIYLFLSLTIVFSSAVNARRLKNPYLLPENVNNYLISISGGEEDLAAKTEELFNWVERYSNHRIRWDTMPLYIMRCFIELAADNLNKPAFLLKKEDFMHHFDIFKGKTLSGVLDFFKNESGSNSIWLMRERMDIMPEGLDEWLAFCSSSPTDWYYVPVEIQAEFLRMAAKELKMHLWSLSELDLHNSFKFLGGFTLSGFCNYYRILFAQGIQKVQELFPGMNGDDLELDDMFCIFKCIIIISSG